MKKTCPELPTVPNCSDILDCHGKYTYPHNCPLLHCNLSQLSDNCIILPWCFKMEERVIIGHICADSVITDLSMVSTEAIRDLAPNGSNWMSTPQLSPLKDRVYTLGGCTYLLTISCPTLLKPSPLYPDSIFITMYMIKAPPPTFDPSLYMCHI